MIEQLVSEQRDKMTKTVESTVRDMAVVRTGKASPALLDNIRVECWGGSYPLKQVAGISAPEPRLLVVQPFDPSTADAVVRAVEGSELGLRASADGPIVRIPIPKLSEERRVDLTKHVKKVAETGRTAIRNIRRAANDSLKASSKAGDITEDEERKVLDRIQRASDEAIAEIDRLLRNKEAEILEV
jgi:ribosome recycling factor